MIELCAEVFDWAKCRRTKGAVKVHLLLDHNGFLPRVAVITDGNRSDIRVARTPRLEFWTLVVMDRGYVDYAWFGQLTADGVVFVTRLKDKAAYHAVETREPPAHSHVRQDEVIHRASDRAATACPYYLRRVEVYDPAPEQILVFLTNDVGLGATTVAAIYKDWRQVELFFEALKQNLKVKTFVGTSANALHIQLWTALIPILVLRYPQLRARFAWSLSNLVALLRMNLFTYRDLWAWLHAPYTTPPVAMGSPQKELACG